MDRQLQANVQLISRVRYESPLLTGGYQKSWLRKGSLVSQNDSPLSRQSALCRLLSHPAEPSLRSQNFIAMDCDRFGIGVWGVPGGGFENLNAISSGRVDEES